MPRPRGFRRINSNPDVIYFKPAGVGLKFLHEIILDLDEFEAIRLKDFLGKDQEICANEMAISQPTFHRLLLSARKKISDALINGKAIRINKNHL